jgi:hypothetical protein
MIIVERPRPSVANGRGSTPHIIGYRSLRVNSSILSNSSSFVLFVARTLIESVLTHSDIPEYGTQSATNPNGKRTTDTSPLPACMGPVKRVAGVHGFSLHGCPLPVIYLGCLDVRALHGMARIIVRGWIARLGWDWKRQAEVKRPGILSDTGPVVRAPIATRPIPDTSSRPRENRLP